MNRLSNTRAQTCLRVGTWASVLLSGCAVGPEYKRPPLPATAGYTAQTLPEATASSEAAGGAAQRFKTAAAIRSDWWT